MGCLFGALLGSAGHQVWMLDKNPDRARTINERGLVVERDGAVETVKVRATTNAREPGIARLVIVCVKAYDTETAARSAAPAVGNDTDVLSLQNGVGNVEAIVSVHGPGKTLGGTTAQGANVVEPASIRHAGGGETVIGQPDGGLERARIIAELLNSAAINAAVTDDLQALVWSKLAINAAINPLTAILGVKNGALPAIEPARAIMKNVTDEITAVRAHQGTRLLFDDPLAKALAVAEATAANVSSMLADVNNKRRTEVDQINGAVARQARALGLEAPINETLARMVAAIEKSYDARA